MGTAQAYIVDLQEKGREFRLRMGPLSSRDGTAAITVAATGVLDYGLPRL